METSCYSTNVVQSNGCRIWENPLANIKYKVPENENKIELFIKNIPKDLYEEDILPHFERFGPVYQFRLLMDFDSQNRGFGYLIFFHAKNALSCLDYIRYLWIREGIQLDVERSEERSHLMALNIPNHLSDENIRKGKKASKKARNQQRFKFRLNFLSFSQLSIICIQFNP
jgi:RNA recognition motif-containing protein